MRWQQLGRTRRFPNPNSEEVFQDCVTNGERSWQRIPSLARSFGSNKRPNTFAQTNLSRSFFACDKAADHTIPGWPPHDDYFRRPENASKTRRWPDLRL